MKGVAGEAEANGRPESRVLYVGSEPFFVDGVSDLFGPSDPSVLVEPTADAARKRLAALSGMLADRRSGADGGHGAVGADVGGGRLAAANARHGPVADAGPPAPVDCVVVDAALPETAGVDFLTWVRRRWADLPAVVLAGDPDATVESVPGPGPTDRVCPGAETPATVADRVRAVVGDGDAGATRDEADADGTGRHDGAAPSSGAQSGDPTEANGHVPAGESAAPDGGTEPDDAPGGSDAADRPDGTARTVEPRSTGDGPPAGAADRLERLHDRAARLQDCSTRREMYGEIIDAAVAVLDFDWCALAVPENGAFELKAVSEDAPVAAGDRHLDVDEGLAGRAYDTGETLVVDDVHGDDDGKPVVEEYRSGLTVPVGEHGVFQAAAAAAGAFDDDDARLADLLMTHAEGALSRVDRERELARQNERLEQFTSVVSHDLRNPLSVAEAEVETARIDPDVEGPVEEYLDRISEAHSRMDDLIEDLLVLAREGEAVSDPDPVRLGEVVAACWDGVVTESATVEIRADAVVRADRNRLRQLFENLFRNAVEHGGDDVEVRVVRTDRGFAVEDDGPGVDPEDREAVFESGHSTASGGTGFGLSIVRRVAEAHGWSVEAVDPVELDGARFEVTGVEFLE